MAQFLYRNLWKPNELRTTLLGVLLVSIGVLLELIFLFFIEEIKNSFFGFLYLEIDLLGGKFTPLLTIFHLVVWGIIFFSTLMVYTVIREAVGARTGLTEVGGIILIFAIITWLLFDLWFAGLLIIVSSGIIAYMYYSLGEWDTQITYLNQEIFIQEDKTIGLDLFVYKRPYGILHLLSKSLCTFHH